MYLLRGGQPPDGRGFDLPSTGAGLAERRCMQSHVASRPAESYDEGPGAHPRVGESRKRRLLDELPVAAPGRLKPYVVS